MKIAYRKKKLRAEALETIRNANEIIESYDAAGFDLTLRQLYYQFVSRGLIANSDKEYKKLGDVISDGRTCGLLSWTAITDRLRVPQANAHWKSPADILRSAANGYNVDLWEGQAYRPEVWIEKDALSGVVEKACRPLDVQFLVCRGYVSQSAMWRAAMRFVKWQKLGQKPVVIHLGDHDPSGIDMTRDIQDRLSEFAKGDVEVRRIALTIEQVRAYDPPPNPAKTSDARFEAYEKEFGDESWELDALDPKVLVDLITAEVVKYCDVDLFEAQCKEQERGRDLLERIASDWGAVKERYGATE